MPAGMFPRLDTIVLRVADLEAARAWYADKLDMTLSFLAEGQIAVFTTGGATSLTLWQLQEGEALPHGESAGSFPIFFSDEVAAHREELQRRGVETGELMHDGDTTYFRFFDLDGNRLEVCQYPET